MTWIYDAAGRLTGELMDGYAPDDALDYVARYRFDLVGNRLDKDTAHVANPGTLADAALDAFFNWTTPEAPTDPITADETISYTYDANDRLTTETAGAKVTSYGYSSTQQSLKEVRDSGTLTSRSEYLYDLQGRMLSVTVTSYTSGQPSRIERTTFDYNAAGIRVSALHETDADANGTYELATRTEYLNDPATPTGYSQVLQETVIDPATGEIQKRVVYAVGLDQITQTTTTYSGGQPLSTETLTFNADGHGSTRLLTDLAGAILTLSGIRQLFAYDAYGNALGFDPAQAATAFLYSGEQLDPSLGLQYLRARYYDPATGRFNRLDPFFGNTSDPLSFHKYLFGHGDPVQNRDPSGLSPLASALSALTIGGFLTATTVGGIIGALVPAGMAAYEGKSADEILAAAWRGALMGALAGGLGYLSGGLLAAFAPWVQYLGAFVSNALFSGGEAAIESWINSGDIGDIASAFAVSGATGGALGMLGLFAGRHGGQFADDVLGRLFRAHCFAPETLIATERGKTAIKNVQPGDKVYAFDFKANQWVLQEVQKRHQSQYSGAMYELTIGDDAIKVTAEHPFWVISGEALQSRPTNAHLARGEDEGIYLPGRWVDASHLRIGDVLTDQAGATHTLERVVRHDVVRQEVCNLAIEGNHSFAVGLAGVLVHNAQWCYIYSKVLPKPPSLVEYAESLGYKARQVHAHVLSAQLPLIILEFHGAGPGGTVAGGVCEWDDAGRGA